MALLGLLAAGGALRIWLIHTWRPAFMGYPDAGGYVYAAFASGRGLLFFNQYRPAGYPMFLIVMHAVHDGLAFAIDIQHLMGLGAAVLLYLAVARFVRRRWVALLPAAVVALSGSQIYLEHAAISDLLYTFLVVLAVWFAARSYDAGRVSEALCLAAAGALIGVSGTVRPVGVFVAPVLVGWGAATRRGWRRRLAAGSLVALGFLFPVGSYLIYQHSTTGTWGLTRTTGETLYARAAIFADCRDFKPPAGTAGLCQPPGAARGNANAYMYTVGFSPALRTFGFPPNPLDPGGSYKWPADAKLEAFALTAIAHQPWDYIWTTIQGLFKYVDPSFGTPNMLEWSQNTLIPQLHNPFFEAGAAGVLAAYYPHDPVVHHSTNALDDYAEAARVEGPVTALLVVLMATGLLLGRGRRRTAAGLFGWTAAVMMLVPVALLFYGVRYATPAYGPLAAAAAIGVDELGDRTKALKLERLRHGLAAMRQPFHRSA